MNFALPTYQENRSFMFPSQILRLTPKFNPIDQLNPYSKMLLSLCYCVCPDTLTLQYSGSEM